jgi:Ferredoxin-like domain in Api92-like protein
MPNWCNNILTVYGPEADIKDFRQKAIGHSPWSTAAELVSEKPNPLNFHSLVPVPHEVLKAGYGKAGYDWEKSNWGCTWGSCHTELVDEDKGWLVYQFDSAWSPPMEFIEAAAKLWPTLTLIMEYEELGMCFKGLAKAEGEKLEDHCVTL